MRKRALLSYFPSFLLRSELRKRARHDPPAAYAYTGLVAGVRKFVASRLFTVITDSILAGIDLV